MRVALDTSAYSEFARGVPGRVRIVQSAADLYLPLFALAELRMGFVSGMRSQQNEAILQQFLRSTRTRVLLPDESTSHHYAHLYRQLKQQGTPIPVNDMWIAALCIQHNLALCTSDRHFDHIPQLSKC